MMQNGRITGVGAGVGAGAAIGVGATLVELHFFQQSHELHRDHVHLENLLHWSQRCRALRTSHSCGTVNSA